MSQRLSHVAVTVPAELLTASRKAEWLAFYESVLGWTENAAFAIPGERVLVQVPAEGQAQYVTVRASAAPMQTSGYEHLGIWVDSESEIKTLHERARRYADRDPAVGLTDLSVRYGGELHTFRVRYVLPLAIEVQWAVGVMPTG
jgi:hypothetical protein